MQPQRPKTGLKSPILDGLQPTPDELLEYNLYKGKDYHHH
jgi:hypothetical protein